MVSTIPNRRPPYSRSDWMAPQVWRHHLRLKNAYALRGAWLEYIVRGKGRAIGDALALLGIFDPAYNYGHQVQKYRAAQRRWRQWRGF